MTTGKRRELLDHKRAWQDFPQVGPSEMWGGAGWEGAALTAITVERYHVNTIWVFQMALPNGLTFIYWLSVLEARYHEEVSF